MNEYFSDLQNEVGIYYKILKFILYFIVGSVFLILISKIVKLFTFIFSKFSKEIFLNRLNFLLKLLIFVFVSTLTGWTLIYIFF